MATNVANPIELQGELAFEEKNIDVEAGTVRVAPNSKNIAVKAKFIDRFRAYIAERGPIVSTSDKCQCGCPQKMPRLFELGFRIVVLLVTIGFLIAVYCGLSPFSQPLVFAAGATAVNTGVMINIISMANSFRPKSMCKTEWLEVVMVIAFVAGCLCTFPLTYGITHDVKRLAGHGKTSI